MLPLMISATPSSILSSGPMKRLAVSTAGAQRHQDGDQAHGQHLHAQVAGLGSASANELASTTPLDLSAKFPRSGATTTA